MAKAEDIELDSTGFHCNVGDWSHTSQHPLSLAGLPVDHLYSDVTSLGFRYTITKKTVNFAEAGTDHDAEMEIYLKSYTEPISLRTSPVLGFLAFNRAEHRAMPIVNLHRDLARLTFDYRLARYLEMIQTKGYFEYDDKRVSVDGTISDSKRNINLYVDKPLLKYPFEVVLPAPKTFANWLKGLRSRQDFVISTVFDGDVFFAILAKCLDLRWE